MYAQVSTFLQQFSQRIPCVSCVLLCNVDPSVLVSSFHWKHCSSETVSFTMIFLLIQSYLFASEDSRRIEWISRYYVLREQGAWRGENSPPFERSCNVSLLVSQSHHFNDNWSSCVTRITHWHPVTNEGYAGERSDTKRNVSRDVTHISGNTHTFRVTTKAGGKLSTGLLGWWSLWCSGVVEETCESWVSRRKGHSLDRTSSLFSAGSEVFFNIEKHILKDQLTHFQHALCLCCLKRLFFSQACFAVKSVVFMCEKYVKNVSSVIIFSIAIMTEWKRRQDLVKMKQMMHAKDDLPAFGFNCQQLCFHL